MRGSVAAEILARGTERTTADGIRRTDDMTWKVELVVCGTETAGVPSAA